MENQGLRVGLTFCVLPNSISLYLVILRHRVCGILKYNLRNSVAVFRKIVACEQCENLSGQNLSRNGECSLQGVVKRNSVGVRTTTCCPHAITTNINIAHVREIDNHNRFGRIHIIRQIENLNVETIPIGELGLICKCHMYLSPLYIFEYWF